VIVASWQPVLFASEAEAAGPYQTSRDLVYASDEKAGFEFQTLDLYWQDNAAPRPVILYVHGGGWLLGDKADVGLKPAYFVPNGFAFISMNYRLRMEFDIYDQLEDIASVARWVRENNEAYGLDPNKIILMGHGAGAHLVSLIATDERYLKAQDVSFDSIPLVVTIDTLSFDIPRVMTELGSFLERRNHSLVFGQSEDVWKAASPISYVREGANTPAFALLYVSDNESTSVQTKSFAKALAKAKVEAILIPGNDKTAQTIDDELGRSDDRSTQALITFIRIKI